MFDEVGKIGELIALPVGIFEDYLLSKSAFFCSCIFNCGLEEPESFHETRIFMKSCMHINHQCSLMNN